MINQYPLWKYLLIVAVLVVGIFFALPNIYGNNPAVQVKADRDAPIDEILEGRVVGGLKSLGMAALRVERDDRNLLLRFADHGPSGQSAGSGRQRRQHSRGGYGRLRVPGSAST